MTNQFKPYLFHYRHDGAIWGIEILASNPEDAQARLQSLTWARYHGEVAPKIPGPGARHDGILGRISAYWRKYRAFSARAGADRRNFTRSQQVRRRRS